ncbi:MAG: SH3 domain-containing protein [Phototrophicaceae bacterium]
MLHRTRFLALVLFGTILLAGCNLTTAGDPTPQPTEGQTPTGRPTVEILSPREGEEKVVNEPVIVSVRVSDSVGVTSVQLSANGQTVRTQAVDTSAAATSQVLLDYTPRSQGAVALRVVAFRGTVASEPAEVNITVRSTQAQVTATSVPGGPGSGLPDIDPNDPTCRALVNTGLNFRNGPGTSFDVIRTLRPGEVLPIIGRLPDNSWWQLRSGVTTGWVSASFVTVYGICTGLPIIGPPATATAGVPTVTPTVATATTMPTNTLPPSLTPTPRMPNLTVTSISGPEDVTIPAGESSVMVTYRVNITNEGGSIDTQFSNVARLLPAGTEFDVGVVSNLSEGQTINLSVEVTFTDAGEFILQIDADSDDEIDESNEADNDGRRNIEVTAE